MQIIVISDTHQYYRNFETILTKHRDADAFIFLGDGQREYSLLCETDPELAKRFHYIKGNCDYGSDFPQEEVLSLYPGHRIFATHGHRYHVNLGTDWLVQAARDHQCDIALYGHTHVSHNAYADGVYVLNPGSASSPRDGNPPSYGIVELSPAGVMTRIMFLEQRF